MNDIIGELAHLRPAIGSAANTTGMSTVLANVRRPVVAIPILVVIGALGYFAYRYLDHNARIRTARETVLPEIERLSGESKWAEAYYLSKSIEALLGDDPSYTKLLPSFAVRKAIKSEPPGAEILLAKYGTRPETWLSLGTTPSETIYVPRGFSRLKLAQKGYVSFDGAMLPSVLPVIHLDAEGSVPENMVHVPAANYILNIPGLDDIPPAHLGDYLIDKFETTNKEFKEFVDQGGYRKQEYWKQTFARDGKPLSWGDAMRQFVDATGRTGPATWELGTYPEGKADYPVAGISWYEAAAYAAFRGKSLPTVYHWNVAGETRASSWIIPASNLGQNGLAPVGQYAGIGPFGTFDMAGNVREWCSTASGNQRVILGGGWNDEQYMFTDFFAQPPFDRSLTNGIRCIKLIGSDSTSAAAYASIDRDFHRDFLHEKSVSDEVFKIYLSMYRYDATPLNARIESGDTTADWIQQKISMDAGYGGEKLIVFLFLPRTGTPPYQSVVYFPGSNALLTRSSSTLELSSIDFIIKSGRAVIYPIYKGTYERGTALTSDYPRPTTLWKEHIIAWVKDIGRSIDYLETCPEIDAKHVAYYGLSWGGMMGPIMTAVERRFKASVLFVAGLSFQRALPEVEAVNYVGRVTLPTIMLNGKYDHFFPVESSQKPLFKLLGTPEKDKKYVLYETGHFVPRNQLIRESLDWLDKYLGPVKQ